MAHAIVRGFACAAVLVLGATLCAQTPATAPSASADGAGADRLGAAGTAVSGSGADQPVSPVTNADQEALLEIEPAPTAPEPSLLDRFFAAFSQREDPDGPINTDRPTFTPANTVVPRGRIQIESGWTFNYKPSGKTRTELYDFPELAVRYGLTSRVEFRTFWLGETDADVQSTSRRPRRPVSGASDMEVGFKWQLFPGDKERKWIPTTALITSIFAPTGGSASISSETVEPYINLLYGWSPTDKLTITGCTGYTGLRSHGVPGLIQPADNYQRYHQSLVAFYSRTQQTTLFYEWYVFMFTNAADNRPLNFMDGGLIYHLTPNIQVDIRAGFGLSGRPDDFFTGTGFSIRF
jgi:hypothetical protein